MLRIRIHLYLGILYPDLALDSDPDHFIIKQKYYGKLNFYYFGTLKNTFLNGFFIGVQKVNDENMRIRIRRTEYASGSGCASRFPDPDQHQKFMDPQHLGGDPLGIMVVYPGYSFLPYQFPGLKKAPYPGSRSATLVEIAAVGSLRTR